MGDGRILTSGELDNSGFGTIMTMWNAWSGWG